jgi:hypothetical protein
VCETINENDTIEIMLAQLELKLDAIKSTITSPVNGKNRRIMSLANLALEITKDIKKELEVLLAAKSGEVQSA